MKKGEVVIFSQYVNARRKNIFGSDADEFQPERWEDANSTYGWAFFLFNGGARTCLGQHFALFEIYYMVIRLFQHYPLIKLPKSEISELTGTERQRLTLALSSADGCVIELDQSLRS